MLMGYLMPCILVMFQLSTFIQGKLLCARPDFINSSTKIIKEHVNKVLITFGGTDPNNLTKNFGCYS